MDTESLSSTSSLKMLRFSVFNGDTNQPIFEGYYRATLDFLEQKASDELRVSAVDLKSWRSMDPVSAETFQEWASEQVLPSLRRNDFNKDLQVRFPSSPQQKESFLLE